MVRGATKEQRDLARAKARCQRRAAHAQARIAAAASVKAKLTAACLFLQAVADDVADDAAVEEMAGKVLKIANAGNKP